ncbi:hypothetical protein BSKO_07226 [Bryopsis sp. KO-2023]|nr:hypothetical protein BSKO_07226 [Bryopsis sp. KO-2023]
MPLIQLRVVGGKSCPLDVSTKTTVGDLQKAVKEASGKQGLILVLRGEHLHDASKVVSFNDGDTILAMPRRQPPPEHISKMSDSYDESPEDDIKFKVPRDASQFTRKLAHFLQHKLRIPDIFLVWLFSIKPKHWAMLIVWIICAPISAKFDLGPVYIIGTFFALMLFNLGTRRAGESSAYSLFNQGFRQLPGQLNADVLDQQIRHGRM